MRGEWLQRNDSKSLEHEPGRSDSPSLCFAVNSVAITTPLELLVELIARLKERKLPDAAPWCPSKNRKVEVIKTRAKATYSLRSDTGAVEKNPS